MDGMMSMFDPSALIKSRVRDPVAPATDHYVVTWIDIILLVFFLLVCVALLKTGTFGG